MPKSVREILDTVPPFNLLPPEVLDSLESKVSLKTYPPGSYVFKQGEKSLNTLFLIVRGSAEVVAASDRGNQAVLGFRGVEEFFGETGITGGQYSASIRAKEELTCLLIPGEEIERLIGSHRDFAGCLTELLVERMRSLYDEIIHEQSFDGGKVETPLFRKRISDIMSSPVITCSVRDTVVEVANLMKSRNISAVMVVDNDNRPVGVITNADLVHKILARSITDYTDIIAGVIMNTDLVTISSEAFYAEALMAVSKYRTKQLAVTRKGKLVGIVTVADLVKTRSTGTLTIIHDIESQEDIEGLAKIGAEVDNLLNALVDERAPVSEILMIVSEFHERLTRKVVQICEQEMIRTGHGPPPVEYCWVNTGSAGRREQASRTDQDNLIIFRDAENDKVESIRDYFLKLALLVNEGLDRCGFAKCPGNVMASNPQWCMSLYEWEKTVENWVEMAAKDPQAIRMLTIFLDFRPVYGEKSLSDVLWEKAINIYKSSSSISHYLAQDDLSARVPVTMWGGFITEKTGPHRGEINLKASAAVHMVNCIRIFALKNGITETNTFKRIEELRRTGGLKPDEADFVETAYETLTLFRIRENLKKVKRGEKADNYVNPSKLSKQEREILKGAFNAVSRLQKLTGSTYTLLWLVK
ncbi:MAG: CBS domain-containing protein [Peptococcaceae bacterium]|nr:CBS domain-containing protein [Peptococcaceae bacterium]